MHSLVLAVFDETVMSNVAVQNLCINQRSMPEVRFQLEWPDGQSSTLYSPSTVILDYFRPGDSLSVSELEARGVEALRAASERVRARFGFACTRTDEEESLLRQWVSRYKSDDTVRVTGQIN